LDQQRWLRTLNIDHHQVLASTDASMHAGRGDARRLGKTQSITGLLGKPGPADMTDDGTVIVPATRQSA
jgi:hypothetical protein